MLSVKMKRHNVLLDFTFGTEVDVYSYASQVFQEDFQVMLAYITGFCTGKKVGVIA